MPILSADQEISFPIIANRRQVLNPFLFTHRPQPPYQSSQESPDTPDPSLANTSDKRNRVHLHVLASSSCYLLQLPQPDHRTKLPFCLVHMFHIPPCHLL